MLIEELIVKKKFQYIWLKSVRDVDLTKHCANCLIGQYDPRINKKTSVAYDLKLDDEDIYYLCGVSEPYNWNNNFHLAFRYKKDSRIVEEKNGITVIIKDAERLPISSEYNDINIRDKAFTSCRNWQFANYFERVIKNDSSSNR